VPHFSRHFSPFARGSSNKIGVMLVLTLSGAKGKGQHPCIFFLPRCSLTGEEIRGFFLVSL
jgi:hypothetical protein